MQIRARVVICVLWRRYSMQRLGGVGARCANVGALIESSYERIGLLGLGALQAIPDLWQRRPACC